MPLTVDLPFLTEVDHVDQQLSARVANEAARVPALPWNSAGYDGRTACLHPLLAVLAALGTNTKLIKTEVWEVESHIVLTCLVTEVHCKQQRVVVVVLLRAF